MKIGRQRITYRRQSILQKAPENSYE